MAVLAAERMSLRPLYRRTRTTCARWEQLKSSATVPSTGRVVTCLDGDRRNVAETSEPATEDSIVVSSVAGFRSITGMGEIVV